LGYGLQKSITEHEKMKLRNKQQFVLNTTDIMQHAHKMQ